MPGSGAGPVPVSRKASTGNLLAHPYVFDISLSYREGS